MRTFYLATVAVFAMTGAAVAADMAAVPYTKAPVAPIAYDWSGFYLGAHAGYAWGHVNSDQFNTSGVFQQSGSSNRDGGFGGGQIGYNLMMSPNWLIGIEADISGGNIKGTGAGCSDTGCSTVDSRIDYFGTVRGRLGYVVNNLMVYGTGGLLWAHHDAHRRLDYVANRASAAVLEGQRPGSSGTSTGWTAGAGVEWGFAPNWSTRVEYLYGELRSTNDFIYDFRLTTADRRFESRAELHSIRIGFNYRLGNVLAPRY